MSALDKAHHLCEALTPESPVEDVVAVLNEFRLACWSDGRVLAPGTIAWLVADFLPRWLAAMSGAA